MRGGAASGWRVRVLGWGRGGQGGGEGEDGMKCSVVCGMGEVLGPWQGLTETREGV